MVSRTTLSVIAALTLGVTAAASAQATGTRPAQHRATASQGPSRNRTSTAAKPAISRDSARALALAQVPNAKVRSERLQRHQGKLVYAVSLRAPNQTSSQRYYVDANTGEVTQAPAASSTTGARRPTTGAAHATRTRSSDTTHRAPTKQP